MAHANYLGTSLEYLDYEVHFDRYQKFAKECFELNVAGSLDPFLQVSKDHSDLIDRDMTRLRERPEISGINSELLWYPRMQGNYLQLQE